MTREECVKLAGYVGDLCPQQHIGKATGLVWHDVLGHLGYAECRQAAALVAGRQPFVAPSEIIAEIAAARSSEQRHSESCRGSDCRNCRYGWCMCVCHPRAVRTLAGPVPKPSTPELAAGPRRYDPAKLAIGRVVPP